MKELTFSREMKEEVKYAQNNCCGGCGEEIEPEKLQVHHKVPKSFIKQLRRDVDGWTLGQFKEYIQSVDNSVALCSPCHRHYDKLALEERIYFGFDKPLGIPL